MVGDVGVGEFVVLLESKEEDLRIPMCNGKLLREGLVGKLLRRRKILRLYVGGWFFFGSR